VGAPLRENLRPVDQVGVRERERRCVKGNGLDEDVLEAPHFDAVIRQVDARDESTFTVAVGQYPRR